MKTLFISDLHHADEVSDDMFAGVAAEDITPITCAICHDPMAQTGNAASPDEGRDFQLRYPEATVMTPSNSVDDVTDPTRFNLCGQCHHSRGRTWQTTNRAPHHSVQANFYVGEIPTPDGTDPLVSSQASVHAGVAQQCAGCHMFRKDYESEQAPAISGHNFEVNFEACVDCHGTTTAAEQKLTALQAEIQAKLDDIYTRLGDPTEWEYTANGGPDEAGQAAIADEIKQARFLYYYVLNDGSLGVHNPRFARALLDKADELLTSVGK